MSRQQADVAHYGSNTQAYGIHTNRLEHLQILSQEEASDIQTTQKHGESVEENDIIILKHCFVQS